MKRETLREFIERNEICMDVKRKKYDDPLLNAIKKDFMRKFGKDLDPHMHVRIVPMSSNNDIFNGNNLQKYYIDIRQGRSKTTIFRSFSYEPSPIEFFALVVFSMRDETIPYRHTQQIKKMLGNKEFSHLMDNVDCNIKTTLQKKLESLDFKLDEELYVFEKGYGEYHLNMTISSQTEIKFNIDRIYVTLVDGKCKICVEDEQEIYGTMEEKIKMVKNFIDIYG